MKMIDNTDNVTFEFTHKQAVMLKIIMDGNANMDDEENKYTKFMIKFYDKIDEYLNT